MSGGAYPKQIKIEEVFSLDAEIAAIVGGAYYRQHYTSFDEAYHALADVNSDLLNLEYHACHLRTLASLCLAKLWELELDA